MLNEEVDNKLVVDSHNLLKEKEKNFKLNEKILKSKSSEQRATIWEYVAKKLWDIIDDIDMYSDMAKEDDKFYRRLVTRTQHERFNYLDSDGYELYPSNNILFIAKKLKRLIKE